MKKLLGILILGLFLNTNAFAKYGKGELKLDPWAVDYFIKYIRGKGFKAPELFIISKDSLWATFYYCPDGAGNCSGSDMEGIKICERKTDTECGLFARGRSIRWKNGINPGKGKASRINSKWSDSEIKAKLTELGFLGGETKEIEKKETKKTEKKETKKTEKTEYQKQKAKDECKELGFAKGTEDFDDCVTIMLSK